MSTVDATRDEVVLELRNSNGYAGYSYPAYICFEKEAYSALTEKLRRANELFAEFEGKVKNETGVPFVANALLFVSWITDGEGSGFRLADDPGNLLREEDNAVSSEWNAVPESLYVTLRGKFGDEKHRDGTLRVYFRHIDDELFTDIDLNEAQ